MKLRRLLAVAAVTGCTALMFHFKQGAEAASTWTLLFGHLAGFLASGMAALALLIGLLVFGGRVP